MLNRVHLNLSWQIGKRTCLIVVLGLIAGNGFCQEVEVDPELATKGSRKVGPFYLRGFLVIQDVGYDDNVFLAGEGEGDTTATMGPRVEALVRFGDRGGLRIFQQFDYVAFGNNTELNHWNRDSRAKGIFLLKRVRWSLENSYLSREERPNPEIDDRVRRNDHALTGEVRTVKLGRAEIDLLLRHQKIAYDPDDLASERIALRLNRDADTVALTGAFQLLPKTAFTLTGEWIEDDFVHDLEGRDTTSRSILAGARMDPSASLQGYFQVGVISLDARSRPESDYRGWVGEGKLTTLLGRRGRVKLTGLRGLEFSTLVENLYFVNTVLTLAYEYSLTRKGSAELLYGWGRNRYPNEVTRLGENPFHGFREDHLNRYQITYRYRANEQYVFELKGQRSIRDSTDDYLDRTRNFYTVGLTYRF